MDSSSENEIEVESNDEGDKYSTPKKDKRGIGCKNRPKHRPQKFRKEWKEISMFKGWLDHDKNDNFKAVCKVCNKNLTSEITVLKQHANGMRHKANIRGKNKNQPDILQFNIKKVDTPTETKTKMAEIKFTGFLAEHDISFNTANHLSDLIRDCFSESPAAKRFSLGRTKCTALVKNVIGESHKAQLITKLKTSKFSILCDEFTDIATVKTSCVVVRFFDEQAKKIKSEFFELLKVYDSTNKEKVNEGATAENLYNGLIDCLSKYKIPFENVVGFGSDGCNTMMGSKNSVASRFKKQFPGINIMKCVCHSIHLCASEACKTLPRACEDLVRNIYSFLNGSAKRQTQFIQFQEYLNVKVHKILHPSQTRWLSLIAVVERVLEQWEALKLYFTDAYLSERLVATEQIYNSLHDPFMKLYFQFLKWILQKFTRFNEYFQSSKVVVTHLHGKISTIYVEILQTFMVGDYVKQTELETIDPTKKEKHLPLNQMYLGVDVMEGMNNANVQSRPDLIQHFRTRCREFLVTACVEIKKRYSFTNPLLSTIAMLQPIHALGMNSKSREQWPSILPLISSVPRALDCESQLLDDEWRKLPIVVDQLPQEITECREPDEFWSKLLEFRDIAGLQEFKHLPRFALNALVVPHANADCERIFSKVNRVKTKSRNKLITETVNGVLLASECVKASGNCTLLKPTSDMMSRMCLKMYDNITPNCEDFEVNFQK